MNAEARILKGKGDVENYRLVGDYSGGSASHDGSRHSFEDHLYICTMKSPSIS